MGLYHRAPVIDPWFIRSNYTEKWEIAWGSQEANYGYFFIFLMAVSWLSHKWLMIMRKIMWHSWGKLWMIFHVSWYFSWLSHDFSHNYETLWEKSWDNHEKITFERPESGCTRVPRSSTAGAMALCVLGQWSAPNWHVWHHQCGCSALICRAPQGTQQMRRPMGPRRRQQSERKRCTTAAMQMVTACETSVFILGKLLVQSSAVFKCIKHHFKC